MNATPKRSPALGQPREPCDAAALEQLARGQVGALGCLYDRHQAHVHRFVAAATHHADDVEDLVHATFLTAAKAAGSFDGRESCRPWLLGIAARLVHRRRRTLARFARALRELTTHQAQAPVDPHRELLARDELSRVSLAAARLSDTTRIVLLLAEIEGLSCEEIAKAVGVPLGTVWRRLHDARRALRSELYEGGEP